MKRESLLGIVSLMGQSSELNLFSECYEQGLLQACQPIEFFWTEEVAIGTKGQPTGGIQYKYRKTPQVVLSRLIL